MGCNFTRWIVLKATNYHCVACGPLQSLNRSVVKVDYRHRIASLQGWLGRYGHWLRPPWEPPWLRPLHLPWIMAVCRTLLPSSGEAEGDEFSITQPLESAAAAVSLFHHWGCNPRKHIVLMWRHRPVPLCWRYSSQAGASCSACLGARAETCLCTSQTWQNWTGGVCATGCAGLGKEASLGCIQDPVPRLRGCLRAAPAI